MIDRVDRRISFDSEIRSRISVRLERWREWRVNGSETKRFWILSKTKSGMPHWDEVRRQIGSSTGLENLQLHERIHSRQLERERDTKKTIWSSVTQASISFSGRKLLNCRPFFTTETLSASRDVNHTYLYDLHKRNKPNFYIFDLVKLDFCFVSKFSSICASASYFIFTAPLKHTRTFQCPNQNCLDTGRLQRATLSGTINYFHGVFSWRTFGGLSE